MDYSIRKVLSAVDPSTSDNVWRYLADVLVAEGDLESCRIKTANVTGITDVDNVNIRLDGVDYTNIPVWMHTDKGARYRIYKEKQEDSAVESTNAEDYFDDAATMFPMAGCVPLDYSDELTIADTYYDSWDDVTKQIIVLDELNTASLAITYYSSSTKSTVKAVDGSLFNAKLIDYLQDEFVCVLKSAYVVIVDRGLSTETVTLDGTLLTSNQYTFISDETDLVGLFIDGLNFAYSTDLTVYYPVECIETLSDGYFVPCADLVAVHRDWNTDSAVISADWARLAEPSQDSIVYVLYHDIEIGGGPVAVIGIKRVSFIDYEDDEAFKTYKILLKLYIDDFKVLRPLDSETAYYSTTILIDPATNEIITIPSLDEDDEPTLPLIDAQADVIEIHSSGYYESFLRYEDGEDEKNAMDAFLSNAILFGNVLKVGEDERFGDFVRFYPSNHAAGFVSLIYSTPFESGDTISANCPTTLVDTGYYLGCYYREGTSYVSFDIDSGSGYINITALCYDGTYNTTYENTCISWDGGIPDTTCLLYEETRNGTVSSDWENCRCIYYANGWDVTFQASLTGTESLEAERIPSNSYTYANFRESWVASVSYIFADKLDVTEFNNVETYNYSFACDKINSAGLYGVPEEYDVTVAGWSILASVFIALQSKSFLWQCSYLMDLKEKVRHNYTKHKDSIPANSTIATTVFSRNHAGVDLLDEVETTSLLQESPELITPWLVTMLDDMFDALIAEYGDDYYLYRHVNSNGITASVQCVLVPFDAKSEYIIESSEV